MGGLEPQESWGTSAFGKRLVWLLSCLKPQQMLTNSFTTPLPHCPEENASQSHCRPFFFSAQVNARSFFFLKKKKKDFIFLAMLGLHCCMWAFSNCSDKQGLLFVAMHRLLLAVAFLVLEHRLWCAQASVVV